MDEELYLFLSAHMMTKVALPKVLYLSIKCTVGILIFCHQNPASQDKLDSFVFTASASRGSVVYWLYQTYLIRVLKNLG